MKVRRSTAGLMALLLIFTLLSGCSLIGDGKEEENPQKQLYFYYPPMAVFDKGLILKFNSMQEKIIVQGEGPGSRGEFMDQLHELNQAGETVPGVILIHDTWLANWRQSKQSVHWMGPVQDKRNRFLQDGRCHALGRSNLRTSILAGYALLYYRKDLMEAADCLGRPVPNGSANQKDNEMEYGFISPVNPRKTSAFGRHLVLLWNNS